MANEKGRNMFKGNGTHGKEKDMVRYLYSCYVFSIFMVALLLVTLMRSVQINTEGWKYI